MRKARREPTATDNFGGLPIFDSIKLEVGVSTLVAMATTLVIIRLDAAQWVELLVMAAVGISSAAWIMFRTREAARAAYKALPESIYLPIHRRGQ